MAKFLRFIFNLLLICYIAAALALFVPPLVGVSTAVTLEGTCGNQEPGTVTYAWRVPVKSLQKGEQILSEDKNTNCVYVYTVEGVDTENSVVNVTGGEVTEVPVRSYAYKVMLIVPYLGYMAIALQTMEGMIILGTIAVVLLLLCILTGIWVRKRKIKRMKEDEEEQEDEENNQFFEELASQKREADARAEADFRARREAAVNTAVMETAEPAIDEEYEELPAPAAVQEQKEEIAESLEAFDEADAKEELEIPAESINLDETAEKLPAEASEEMAVERAVATGNIPGVQAALEAALDTQQIQRHVRRAEVVREPEMEQENLPAEEIELAMPVRTVDEYLQKAYAAGEDPVVRKDELTGVTYVDFSECI